jgi:threonine/homoserine/homoserine lactone efflux protein
VTHGLVIAIGFAFAAGVQPGPLQAFLLSQVAARGWVRTLPAACSPLLSDGPIALVVLLVLEHLPPGVERILRGAGGLLLLWLAWSALREWRAGRESRPPGSTAASTLVRAALVNVLNPNPYLGWSLVLGPLVLEAWQRSAGAAVAIVAAFYVTIVTMLALNIVVFGAVRSLGPRVARGLLLSSVIALVALGAYQLVTAVR